MKKIMLIDDDETVGFYVDRLLSLTNRPSILRRFSNGKVAYEFLCDNFCKDEFLPDIIFLDINMPIMDGWDFLRSFQRIKHALTKTPLVYMLSSSDLVVEIHKALSTEMVKEFITKPIRSKQLEDILDM